MLVVYRTEIFINVLSQLFTVGFGGPEIILM